MEFLGAALPPERLQYILEELFHSYGSAANEFAGAANLAFGLPHEQVEIKVDDGISSSVLVRQVNGTAKVHRLETSSRAHTSFQLTRSASQSVQAFGTTSPEYLSVVRRFRLAPFELAINLDEPPRSQAWGKRRDKGFDSNGGVRLSTKLFSLGQKVCRHHHVAELRICHEETGLNGVGLRPSQASSLVTVGTSPGSSSTVQRCRLAFGLCSDASLGSNASWVYGGETLQVFPVQLPLPGVEVAIDASDLKLDATRERFVQDENFSALWEEVKREFLYFAKALQTAYPSSSASKSNAQAFFDKEARWTKHYLELKGQGVATPAN